MQFHRFSENALLKSLFHAVPSNGTQTSLTVDTQGYRRACLVVDIVTGAATTVQVALTESAVSGSGFSAAITGSTIPAVAQAATLPASGTLGQPYLLNIDLEYRLRYFRVSVIGTGTAGNVYVGILLMQPFSSPPTQDFTSLSI